MAESQLASLWAARDRCKASDGDELQQAREAMAVAMDAVLSDLAARDVGEVDRRALDEQLAPHAADLKGALLKALRVCRLARAFLGLPGLMEETRRLLCAAPAKGVASYLEEALISDIGACGDGRAVACTVELLEYMLGFGRLKKELSGFDLPAPHKKSVRTAINKAKARHKEIEDAQRAASAAAARPSKPVYEMETDFRVEEAEEQRRREAGREAAMEGLFVNVAVSKRGTDGLSGSRLSDD